MGSWFVAPGTSAANNQAQGEENFANQFEGLAPALSTYLGQQNAYQASSLPTGENAVNQLGQFTTQGGRNQMTQAYNQYAQAQGRQNAAGVSASFAGNPSLAQGFQLGSMNDANTAANSYAAQVNSPQGMANAYSTYMGARNALAPNYQGADQLASAAYGQMKQPVGEGLMGYLGQIAGMYGESQGLPTGNLAQNGFSTYGGAGQTQAGNGTEAWSGSSGGSPTYFESVPGAPSTI
jgi:hypothetical protein